MYEHCFLHSATQSLLPCTCMPCLSSRRWFSVNIFSVPTAHCSCSRRYTSTISGCKLQDRSTAQNHILSPNGKLTHARDSTFFPSLHKKSIINAEQRLWQFLMGKCTSLSLWVKGCNNRLPASSCTHMPGVQQRVRCRAYSTTVCSSVAQLNSNLRGQFDSGRSCSVLLPTIPGTILVQHYWRTNVRQYKNLFYINTSIKTVVKFTVTVVFSLSYEYRKRLGRWLTWFGLQKDRHLEKRCRKYDRGTTAE